DEPALVQRDLLRLVPVIKPCNDRGEVRQIEERADAERVHELARSHASDARRILATTSAPPDARHSAPSGTSAPGRSSAVPPTGAVDFPLPRRQGGASPIDDSSVRTIKFTVGSASRSEFGTAQRPHSP